MTPSSSPTGERARSGSPLPSFLRSRPAILIAVLATLFLGVNFGGEALSIRQEEERLATLQAENQALQERRDHLEALVAAADTAGYIEHIARDQMFMRYQTDQVWIPWEGKAGAPTVQAAPTAPTSRSDPARWSPWRQAPSR